MKRLKILIIIGHGGNDVGAVGNGLREVDCNYQIAWSMYNFMKPYADIYIESNNLPLGDEVGLVNSGKYDLVISIHNNAGGGNGWEGYHYRADQKGIAWLKAIESEVVKLGQQSRGIKDGSGLRIINSVRPTSILLEGFFLDNKDDMKDFDEKWEQERLGQAYAKGTLNYLGINYTSTPTPSPSGKMYRVITGSFKERKNAENRLQELKNKGFDSFIEVK